MDPWMWLDVKRCREPVRPVTGMTRQQRRCHGKSVHNSGSTARPALQGMSPKLSRTSNSDLYKFHRPKLRVRDTPHPLKWESELCAHPSHSPDSTETANRPLPHRCLRNLSTHRTKRPAPPYPRAHSAAVLVALFVGRAGDLYVLLSQ